MPRSPDRGYLAGLVEVVLLWRVPGTEFRLGLLNVFNWQASAAPPGSMLKHADASLIQLAPGVAFLLNKRKVSASETATKMSIR